MIIKDFTPLRELPVVPLRGLVVFPESRVHFEISRQSSIAALKAAMREQQEIFLVAQKDLLTENPTLHQLHSIGVIATVRQVLKGSAGEGARVYVEGQCRAQCKELVQEKPCLRALVAPRAEPSVAEADKLKEKALLRQAKHLFDLCARYISLPPDIPLTVLSSRSAGKLANFVADSLSLPFEEKQSVLEETDPLARLKLLCVLLAREHELQQVEVNINEQVQNQMEQNQRENFLREQRRAISAELGESDSTQEDAAEYREKLLALHLPQDVEEKLHKDCTRLERMQIQSPESAMLSVYLETTLGLPWNKLTQDRLNLEAARKKLAKDHYGLKEVKERILQMLAVRKLSPDITGQILCLVGPPGVGKTSVAHSVADAMGRKFARISLGGIRDEAEIRGHRKTYIGAMPGRIINALVQAGSRNPVLLLDEIDKLCSDFRGDPASALLEVMDGEQNATFRDHYVELPFDLSRVLFITTANDRSSIPMPLLDRMEVIELPSYTAEEKFHIAKDHLLPKQIKKHGLQKSQLRLHDDCLRAVIDGYTREAGVRKLEQRLAALCRKCAVRVAEAPEFKLSLKADALEAWLGARKYKEDHRNREARVGVVNGLAWTSVGGDIMPIEALVLPGTGKLKLTGSLGNVMKESAEAAVSYLRYHAKALELPPEFYRENDIHIHVPEGAVPKDGPSAGVTLFTALLSALSGIKVNPNLAMTGEITLTGRVLPIGGLREKAMAAYRSGVFSVLIPEENLPDLEEVDDAVKAAVRFHGIARLSELPGYALLTEPELPGDIPAPESAKQELLPKRRRPKSGVTMPA
ncbi:MAG: endopeptidase La [Oscillospiraceae bacterium]|jgi:ATP-dependent Lon protease|nr:endopeptidase La [Oscillospiraceae bacterium]